MKTSTEIKIGITGHRNIDAQKTEIVKDLLKACVENIIALHKKSDPDVAVTFLSALAYGADSLFIDAVIDNNIPGKIHYMLPFGEAHYEEDFIEKPKEREHFKELLRHKDAHISIVGNYKSENKDQLYLDCGKRIADESNYLIAVWNEKPAAGIGGTGDVVPYAKKNKDKNILVINPEEENPRIKWDYLPVTKSKDPKDITEVPEEIAKVPHDGNFIKHVYDIVDRTAMDAQESYNKIWNRCFTLGSVAAGLLALKVSFHNMPIELKFLFTLYEASFFTYIFWLIRKEKRSGYHKQHLEYRFVAERLRIYDLFYAEGLPLPAVSSNFVFKNALSDKHKTILLMCEKITELCGYRSVSTIQSEAIQEYITGQHLYHGKKKERFKGKHDRNKIWSRVFIYMFLGITGLHLLVEILELPVTYEFTHFHPYIPELPNAISIFLVLLLPALIARFEGTKFINEWERRIDTHKEMEENFKQLIETYEGCTNKTELQTMLNDLYNKVLIENADWQQFMIYKNEPITI